jgi:general stress protein CsbA
MTPRSSESRRISSLLVERRVSGTAMVVVLSVALLFGLVGFAFHTLWIVAIIAIALGLGYVVANARQDHREVVDRR